MRSWRERKRRRPKTDQSGTTKPNTSSPVWVSVLDLAMCGDFRTSAKVTEEVSLLNLYMGISFVCFYIHLADQDG